MISSTVIILITCIILSAIMVKRIIVHPVIIKLLGIFLIEFTVLEYAVRFSTYYSLNLFEQRIYFLLNSINFTIPHIALAMNIGTALLLVSSAFYVDVFVRKKRYIYLLIIPVILFLVVNHPYVCEKLYIYTYKDGSGITSDFAVSALKYANVIIIAVYGFLPYLMHIIKYCHTRLWYKKRNYLFSLLIIFMMDLLLYPSIIFGNMSVYFILNLSLIKHPITIANIDGSGFSLAYTILIFAVTLYILIRIKPLGKIKRSIEDIIIPDSTPQTVSMMLHGYKNAFMAIEMFADDNNKSFLGSDDKRFEKIKEIAVENEEKIKYIINVINANRNISLMRETVSLNSILDKAIEIMKVDDSVRIEKNFARDYIIFADEYHFREVIVCLLNNAYESFHEKNGDKVIVINTGADDGDIYVEIIDNGCGIKNRKEIFNPFYSSKNGGTNCGIGLTYAKNIIEAHEGIINISSKENEGTTVQIILKADRKMITKKDMEELMCQKSE